MKRRGFLKASSLTALLARAGGSFALRTQELPSQFTFASPPVLQNPVPDGITVAWVVNGLTTERTIFAFNRRLSSRLHTLRRVVQSSSQRQSASGFGLPPLTE